MGASCNAYNLYECAPPRAPSDPENLEAAAHTTMNSPRIVATFISSYSSSPSRVFWLRLSNGVMLLILVGTLMSPHALHQRQRSSLISDEAPAAGAGNEAALESFMCLQRPTQQVNETSQLQTAHSHRVSYGVQ